MFNGASIYHRPHSYSRYPGYLRLFSRALRTEILRSLRWPTPEITQEKTLAPRVWSRYWTGNNLQWAGLMWGFFSINLHWGSIPSKLTFQSNNQDTQMVSSRLTLDSLVWFRPLSWHQSNTSARFRKRTATDWGTKTKLQKRRTLKSTSAFPGKK